MNDVAGRALVLALVLLCASATAIAGAGAAPTVAADDDPEGNDTVRHQHPDEYAADGDLDRLESWLSDRLSGQLQESTIALSEGEYELARDLVDAEYRDRLGQYAEVAGETDEGDGDGGDDDATAPDEAFADAGDDQETFVNQTEAYRETKAEYEAAREAGDDERARELARELEAIAAEIDAVGEDLVVTYEVISFETDEDLSAAAAAINETRTEIRDEQTVVREREFVETELHLAPAAETVSFRDPLVAGGELRTADGSTIDEVRLVIDGDPVTVEPAADGAIEFEYRPTTQSLATETLPIAYVPAPQSPYLGSETALNVSIEQVEPTLTIHDRSDAVAYGDALAIEGELTAADVPVDGVAVAAELDGERLGTLPVTDGRIDGSVSVPAAVRDGDRTLRLTLPFEDRALAGTTVETAVTVAETETDLTIDATPANETAMTVTGRLATVDDDGVADQPVTIRRDGEPVATVTTTAAGEFNATVAVPPGAATDVTLAAEYEGADTNLAAAATETTVAVGQADGPSTGLPSWVLALVAALGGLGVIGGYWWWTRGREMPADDTGAAAAPAGEPAADESAAGSDPVASLLAAAREQLADGHPDAAVRSYYAAVRYAFDRGAEHPAALTHWEFYRRYGDETASAETGDPLREIVTAYERAAFAPDGVDRATAEHVLDCVRDLGVGTSRAPSDATPEGE